MKNKNSIINLNVLDDSNFLSLYSLEGKPVISSEIADFLENSAKEFHPKDDLTLNIYSSCIDNNEKAIYSKAIKNYFDLQIKSCNFELKRKTFVGSLFSLVGIIALGFMFILSNKEMKELWIECIDIFAWVFLWEAVDQLFIERGTLITKRKRFNSFYNMKINFYESNKKAL